MKYAHLADLHLGSWRDPKMRDLSTKSFLKAMDECQEEKVDFIIFAGDIFNTSLPSLDTLKIVTAKLKNLQDGGIPVYVIAGSHDFSPSGKTMIEVLESAGLVTNVCKGSVNEETKQLHLRFTVDEKTGAKLTGILGRKGLLDQKYYQNLYLENLEAEEGYKIFLFHTAITELMPSHLEMMETQPASIFPKSFQYYAGGHIHHQNKVDLPGYGPLTYPGALFPNNFAEMEKYGKGGYYLIEDENIDWKPLNVVKHVPLIINCHHLSPEMVENKILQEIENAEIIDSIITLRLHGTLENGRVSDIPFKSILQKFYQKGAYFVMKNTVKLTSPEYEDIKIAQNNPELIEEETIKEHLQQNTLFDKETEFHLVKSLLASLNTFKKEGETSTDFQRRMESEVNKILEI